MPFLYPMESIPMNRNVEEWLDNNQNEMIDFLCEYIQYESATGDEEVVQRHFIEPFFRDKMDWDEVELVDVTNENNRPNVNGRLIGMGNGKNLLFNGHSDVVDITDEDLQSWNYDPWDPVIDEGNIYGRGSNDMKGPNTAMIWAVKAIMESNIELQGNLLMSIVVGEELGQQEVGSIPATNNHLQQLNDELFCINTEPTNNEIHTKSSATFDFSIDIQGKSIHTSQRNLTQYPQRFGIPDGNTVGVDASKIMMEIIRRFNQLEDEWNFRYEDEIYGSGGYPIPQDIQGVGLVSINCTKLRSGDYISKIPGFAKIEGHVFYPPEVDENELWNEMKATVDSLKHTSDWIKEHPPKMNWKDVWDWPPFKLDVEHPGCQTLGNSVEEITGNTAVFSGFKPTCDNTYIQMECGVDTISFGPGDISMGAHGPDEYLPLDQFMTAAKIYADMIIRWCGIS